LPFRSVHPWQLPVLWQTPSALQTWVFPHAWQATPPAPHWALFAPVWQALLESQQPAQLMQPPSPLPPVQTPL
jgi:hypothetical protein